MLLKKPPMGWNTWNTFGHEPNEQLIIESADAMVNLGYKDAGYEYIIIDDCWSLKERDENGKLVADPEKFPHGMKYIADYIHSKGLKFGMYSCAGVRTCADYPSSYGYEYIDAKTFAEWEIDYLKYDFCYFPSSGDGKNAYLTMAQALRTSGRDIVFAACNWGTDDPAKWMRSRGAHTWRSTHDINDSKESFMGIILSQLENQEASFTDCYNDMDMLTVGMHGKGLVGVGGCTDEQYVVQFAMWAFMGGPLIMGGDIRNMDEKNRALLQNKGLIEINQDEDARPPYFIQKYWEKGYLLGRLLSNGEVAIALLNDYDDPFRPPVSFTDLGYPVEAKVEVTDVITGECLGVKSAGMAVQLEGASVKIYRLKLVSL